MGYENLSVSVRDALATVTIDRPEKLNALDRRTMDEIDRVFSEISGDDRVRAVVVTGSGDKAFVAGADIRELSELDVPGGQRAARRGQEVFGRIESLGKPVVAAVNGYALGGGLELALACHLRVAASGAKLGLPEVSLGIIPGYGGTQRLSRLVGKGRALEMILTGAPIDADEAHRIGLVNRVVPAAELLSACEALLGKILSNGPVAVSLAIQAVNQGLETDLETGLVLESTLFGILFGTRDLEEGMGAFLEKRKPGFEGR